LRYLDRNIHPMKKLLPLFALLLISFFFVACDKDRDNNYTNNVLEFNLFQGSDFDYKGKLIVKELTSRQLELNIELEGPKESNPYFFPAHLHFGSYDKPDSPIAFMLNPVDIRDLRSQTLLGTLSNGESLTFEQFRNFDGHIKVHLAEDGPDYLVILAIGNVGSNSNLESDFQRDQISICLPSF